MFSLRSMISSLVASFLPSPEPPVSRVPHKDSAWTNMMTGLGDPNRDRMASHLPSVVVPLDDETLIAMHGGDWAAARAVEALVRCAMRQSYLLAGDGDACKKVRDEWRRLGAWRQLKLAAVWGRLFGRGHLLIGALDGQEAWKPLNLKRIDRIAYLKHADATESMAAFRYSDPLSPQFGEPETWSVRSNAYDGTASIMHATRMVLFGGAITPRRKRAELRDRDYSVLQRFYDPAAGLSAGLQSAATMLTDCSQGVLKIPNLSDLSAGNDMTFFRQRLRDWNLWRSSLNAVAIDKEEDFSFQERSFNQVPEVLGRLMDAAAGAAEQPSTVFFGRSPAGMSATGKSDQDNWYDVAREWQEDELQPGADRLLEVTLAALKLPGDSVHLSFPPLILESGPEHATKLLTWARIHQALISSGIALPDEALAGLIQNGRWTEEPPLVDPAVKGRQPINLELAKAQNQPADGQPAGGSASHPA